MARFHPLTVTHVHRTIRDAVVLTLQPEDPDTFDFLQGQYLTFKRNFDGVELRRSYSICAGRQEGVLQVGIKKVPGGAFSTWANEHIETGTILHAMPPRGAFHTPLDPAQSKTYLGFAAGSGITPVLSILKTILAGEPKSRFILTYANRGLHSIMFREELEDLKNRYMDRLSLIHILKNDAQGVDLFQGRIDQGKCAALFKHWIPIQQVDTAFICGPEPLMRTIVDALRAHGLDDDQIKFELFASAQPGCAAQPARVRADSSRQSVKATIALDGSEVRIDLDPGVSLLDGALAQGLDPPYACKAGVCSTCKCRVIQGEAEMATNHALDDDEVSNGYVLSCQAFALSAAISVAYEDH